MTEKAVGGPEKIPAPGSWIANALLQAMASRVALPKDGENKAMHYDYTTSETVFREVPPLLARVGLILVTLDSGIRTEGPDSVYWSKYQLWHPASGERWEFLRELPIGGGGDKPKRTLANDTTMLAYTYRGLLSLERAEEVDNQPPAGKAPARAAGPSVAPKATPTTPAPHPSRPGPSNAAKAPPSGYSEAAMRAGMEALYVAGYEDKEIDALFQYTVGKQDEKTGKWSGGKFGQSKWIEVPLREAQQSVTYWTAGPGASQFPDAAEQKARRFGGVVIYKEAAKAVMADAGMAAAAAPAPPEPGEADFPFGSEND